MNRKRQIFLMVFSMIFVAGLTACGSEDKQVFSVNGETLSYREVAAFGLVYAKEHNIIDRDILAEVYEDDQTYGDYYMERFEEEIVETLLLAKEARSNKIKLSDEEKQTMREQAASLAAALGEDFLKELKVENTDLEKIYELKLFADAYIKHISEGDNVDGSNDEDDGQQERYIRVYQVTFRTAEVDEDGLVKSDQDGNVIQISQSEVMQKKQEADEFVEKVQAGEDMESLLKNYDARVTGMEQYLKYKDLAPEYKAAVDNMREGEVSGVISSIYGYYVIKLLNADAKELSETLAQYANQVEEQDRADEKLEQLYSLYIGNDTQYKDQELWDSFKIEQFIK